MSDELLPRLDPAELERHWRQQQQRFIWPQYASACLPYPGDERNYGELALQIQNLYDDHSYGPDDDHDWPEEMSDLERHRAINHVLVKDPDMKIILARWGAITATEANMRHSAFNAACINLLFRADVDVDVEDATSPAVELVLWEQAGLLEPLPGVDA